MKTPITAHELARLLLEEPPEMLVYINGWGSGEGTACAVTHINHNPGDNVEPPSLSLGHDGCYTDEELTHLLDWHKEQNERLRNAKKS